MNKHPNDNLLFLYYEGLLDKGADEVRAHLDGCAECSGKLARQAVIDRRVEDSLPSALPATLDETIKSQAFALLAAKRRKIEEARASAFEVQSAVDGLLDAARGLLEVKALPATGLASVLLMAMLLKQEGRNVGEFLNESTIVTDREGEMVYEKGPI